MKWWKRREKSFSLATIIILIIHYSRAYHVEAEINRSKINAEQYASFLRCQAAGRAIRNASESNITLPGIPAEPITDTDVSFLLYTRKNSAIPQILHVSDSIETIQRSSIDFSKQTILAVHGARDIFLSEGILYPLILLPRDDINIIITNWDSYSFYDIMYLRNMVTPRLGNIVGQFLRNLIIAGADPKKIDLMGYSTGGQVVGLAAKQITPKVARITAFDPQGSCFNFLPASQRLAKTDADYVQIVHCTVGESAMPLNFEGNVTFYVNGGLLQPECLLFPDEKSASLCSHFMCGLYSYLSLLRNNALRGIKCRSYSHYLLNTCDCQDLVTFEYNPAASVAGLYFMDTYPSAMTKICNQGNNTVIPKL